MSNHIPIGFTAVSTAVPHIKTGRLHAIAVTSLKRLTGLSSVPTVAESGFPDYEVTNFIGIVATAGTNASAVRVLNASMSKVIATDDFKERMGIQGFEVTGSTPADFGRFIAKEVAKWDLIVVATGMKPN